MLPTKAIATTAPPSGILNKPPKVCYPKLLRQASAKMSENAFLSLLMLKIISFVLHDCQQNLLIPHTPPLVGIYYIKRIQTPQFLLKKGMLLSCLKPKILLPTAATAAAKDAKHKTIPASQASAPHFCKCAKLSSNISPSVPTLTPKSLF